MCHINEKEYPEIKKTKIMLINGLLDIMKTQSIEDITIKNLADYAQVGRKTFYRHYEKKEDVFRDYLKLMIDDYINTLPQNEEPSIYIRTFYAFIWWRQHNALYDLIDKDLLFEIFLEESNHLIDGYRNKYMKALNVDSSSLETYSLLYNLAGFCYILTKWLKHGMKESPEEMAQLCTEVMTK